MDLVERHAWHSPNVGREMPVLRYGNAGTPLIYVPSSAGDQEEFADYGMPEACDAWVAAGRVQFFSIDGSGPKTLFNDRLTPRQRIRAYVDFERYAVDELLPWVIDRSGFPRVVVVGASYGAFVAANLLFKRFRQVSRACGLGGVYGLWHRLDGYHDEDVYHHTPLEYLPRLREPALLEGIRRTDGITMFGAGRDEWLPSTRRLESVLREKKIPHRTEIWPAPADHHERWWKPQLVSFLGREYRKKP